MRSRSARALTLALCLGLGCAINPATGRLQFSLLNRNQEEELGAKADAEIQSMMDLGEDEALTAYVADVGQRMAAVTERADLDWTFRVLDDPTPNAFALPGGYVYVTRGLLAHLDSEAELAAVLAHEAGHVAARHGVDQYSRARIAEGGLGIFRVIDPRDRHIGGLFRGSVGSLLMRHSRAQEEEADDLAIRYLTSAGYDPHALVGVLGVLQSIEGLDADEDVSTSQAMSTHPATADRLTRARPRADAAAGAGPFAGGDREGYLARVDGILYGPDARRGFVDGDTYHHPASGFQLPLPSDWEAARERDSVAASSPDENALVFAIRVTDMATHELRERFFENVNFDVLERLQLDGAAFPAEGASLAAGSGDDALRGLIMFVETGREETFVVLGLSPAAKWGDHEAALRASVLGPDRTSRSPRPTRLRIRKLTGATSLRDLHQGSPLRLAELAVLNRTTRDAELPAGAPVKTVVGDAP